MAALASKGTPFTPDAAELQKALHYLNDEEKTLLASYVTGMEYAADTTVMREGETNTWMAFVADGKLAVKKESDFPGKAMLVAILETGSMVGEISVLERGKRMATIEVVEKCRLLHLSSDQFENLLREQPYLGITILKRILHVVGVRVKKADDRLGKLL